MISMKQNIAICLYIFNGLFKFLTKLTDLIIQF